MCVFIQKYTEYYKNNIIIIILLTHRSNYTDVTVTVPIAQHYSKQN